MRASRSVRCTPQLEMSGRQRFTLPVPKYCLKHESCYSELLQCYWALTEEHWYSREGMHGCCTQRLKFISECPWKLPELQGDGAPGWWEQSPLAWGQAELLRPKPWFLLIPPREVPGQKHRGILKGISSWGSSQSRARAPGFFTHAFTCPWNKYTLKPDLVRSVCTWCYHRADVFNRAHLTFLIFSVIDQ